MRKTYAFAGAAVLAVVASFLGAKLVAAPGHTSDRPIVAQVSNGRIMVASRKAPQHGSMLRRSTPRTPTSSLPSVLPTDPLERDIAIFKIDRAELKQLGTFTDLEGRLHTIYFGPTTDGNTCLFETIQRGTAAADTPLGPQGGGCRPASVTGDILRWSAHFNGSPDDNTGFYIYGIASANVSAVEMVDSNGRRHAAHLAPSGAFFYQSATGSPAASLAITASDSSGNELSRTPIGS